MQPGLSLRVSQQLSLTPQLQQSIRLLQLTTLEIAQEVEHMLDDNPFLERAEDPDTADTANTTDTPDAPQAAPSDPAPDLPPSQPDDDWGDADAANTPELLANSTDGVSASDQNDAESGLSWEGDNELDSAHTDGEWGFDGLPASGTSASHSGQDDETDWLSALGAPQTSLTEHLHRQALALRLGELDRAALYVLIESLNDDGYLEEPLEALIDSLLQRQYGPLTAPDGSPAPPQTGIDPASLEAERQALHHHFTVALGLLHNLEPAGVGARSLNECLCLQLRSLRHSQTQPNHDPDPDADAVLHTAWVLCQQPLELLAKRDLRRLGQATGHGEAQLRAALGLIGRLEPRPGRRFADVQRFVLVPDVIVRRSGRGFAVQLNPEVMPRLRVQETYANALRTSRRSDNHAGLQAQLQEARWFIKNIQQRFDTILRVAQAIVVHQRGFFEHGEVAMRPLVLRDIAEELGLHESTISRVTAGKYMATPQGTYELKYFFGSGLGTDTGGNASSTAVRALLRQLIADENPAKPLSDNRLAELLKDQGIECARRTVAKYREALKIPPASQRKTL